MSDVPRDDEAEEVVIGCSVASAAGYRRAVATLTAASFWLPAHTRLFTACAQIEHLDGDGIDVTDLRILDAARIGRVDPDEVRRIVDERPVQWDRSGSYAARVARAARHRLIMSTCAMVFNRLGEGERLEDLEEVRALASMLEGVA